MTISYNWLSEYLPEKIDPERLSRILTSIGLEVESLEKYEEVKGGLQGLVTGEVLTCEQHPNADKLKLTTVDIGAAEPLQIVCGAPNVAVGQKVIVAPVGTTIYPSNGDPLTMKVAKIRGVESYGMICAEDEIGLGDSHAGIIVLPAETAVGISAADYFKPYQDYVYEIGLTPNRMDAMSHLGVARDVCAYIMHHDKKDFRVKSPSTNSFKPDNNSVPISVTIENKTACERYSGVSIKGVKIAPSPKWLTEKLKAIGVKPINNIVDITNFVLHETGQPLHAFDADEIKGNQVIVKNLPDNTPFLCLDGKERKLNAADLMICNAEEPMCIAGVYGGLKSGVSGKTVNIFLESAWFEPTTIRQTSFRHGLRTDAATRFEKGVDISNTVNVLKRAALLIKEIAGGEIASDLIDVYPSPQVKTEVTLKHHYLKKLSGKNYHPDTVRKILTSLGFEFLKEGQDDTWWAVPFSKRDITQAADIVEEIMRIDGLDNVEIPDTINISPSVEKESFKYSFKEKIAGFLTGNGFHEIFTNSITNSAYYSEEELATAVKMVNNLSAELNIMRPDILQTGLESVAFNINRKNSDIRFFDFGKTYKTPQAGEYIETNHLAIFVTGNVKTDHWKHKANPADFYYIKGIVSGIINQAGIGRVKLSASSNHRFDTAVEITVNDEIIGVFGNLNKKILQQFDIKQPVFFADINWDLLTQIAAKQKVSFREIPRHMPVQRDLAVIVPESLPYSQLEQTIEKVNLPKLKEVRLFDIFKSEKIGSGKKSLAINFTFQDEEKTLTDKEIDAMMNKLMTSLEKEVQAEIRK
ncbi:MAG TPA: phenylalanine--tRNA ligase subunit beta [Parasegetibacter sp.]